MSEVERVLSLRNQLGEGALWSASEQTLYWVDIRDNCFYRYQPATGQYERIEVGIPIGVMAFRKGGGLIMATKRGFATWSPETGELQYIAEPEADKPHMRFNDGAVDRSGRFFAGTMAEGDHVTGTEGSLYRLDPDGSLHVVETGVGCPNGIGWSLDNTTMYFTDTTRSCIYAYDYDAATGDISHRRVFIKVPREAGFPDGFAMDNEGYIWSACWDGARIIRIDPDGKIERTIPVPALRPTSCVFAGPQMNELYITSSAATLTSEQLSRYPYSGDLMRLQTEFTGPERNQFAG